MAGGKISPRQKMINMMYLVLTALLAMNVSAEILNAFKTVNNSIMTSNKVTSEQNATTYSSLEDALKDQQTAAKAAIWSPKAKEIQKISSEMFNYIEGVKTKIKEGAGLTKNAAGEEEFKVDDLDVSTRIMIDGKDGQDLYAKMNQFKKEMIGSMDPSKFSDPATQGSVKADVTLAGILKSLPVNMEVMKASAGHTQHSNDAKGWTEANFHMTPAIATITILSKLQNDVKNTEAQLSSYCLQQLGKVKVVYDNFAAIATASTNYCMPGDPIEVSAGVGAFSAAAKPTISINGSGVPLGPEGMAVWKTTAGGGGKHSIPVNITFTKPDGSKATKSMNLEYTVGTPGGVAVMLDKTNVMYVGVPNPLTVSSGKGDEQTTVTGQGISLTKNGPGKYTGNVTAPGDGSITVSIAGGSPAKFPIRIKRIPDPAVMLGGVLEPGPVQKGTLVAQSGLVAMLKDFLFDARFDVVSFDMVFSKSGEIFVKSGSGPMISADMKQSLAGLKAKDIVVFENLKVKGPDGQVRKIKSISYRII